MKNFLISCLLLIGLTASAATYPNLFTTTANPATLPWSNNVSLVFGSTNATSISTNLNQAIINPVDGVGITGARLGSGMLWNATTGGSIWGFGTSSWVAYTNAVFGAGMLGNANTLTNISGLGFSSGTATLNNTNLNFVIGNLYQTLTLGANCNITNVSGLGSGALKMLPGGSDRVISFPTNWCWLQTNGLALVGPLYSITLTNRASRVGWLSVVTSGTDPTNVTAAYLQSP